MDIIIVGGVAWIIVVILLAMVFKDNKRNEPRCDMTGQPLTPRQQFDRECG